ncbi:glycosyltransferase, partial [Zoogloea sp. LCSB751]|uniref:glycosyltransferase n=1 Tax=Zoogloea sp. LCSB751 TaxID=1965277 RepID=UPI001116A607
MAMGVVPIVLNNPAERNLVQHMETGLIVNTPDEFADAVAWMSSHAEECRAMSMQAATQTRQRFAIGHTLDQLTRHYRAVLTEDKG